MHYAIFTSLLTSFVTLSGYDYHRCLLVDPLPPAATDLANAAPRQHQQPYQLGEAPAKWRGGHRVQCGYQSFALFV